VTTGFWYALCVSSPTLYPGRVRLLAGGLLLSLGLLLTLGLITTVFRKKDWDGPGCVYSLEGGCFEWTEVFPIDRFPVSNYWLPIQSADRGFTVWPLRGVKDLTPITNSPPGTHYFDFSLGPYPTYYLALWPLPAIILAHGGLLCAWGCIARSRTRKGICPRCNYSQRGLPEGSRCPECGI
jgi:hypothetical protein